MADSSSSPSLPSAANGVPVTSTSTAAPLPKLAPIFASANKRARDTSTTTTEEQMTTSAANGIASVNDQLVQPDSNKKIRVEEVTAVTIQPVASSSSGSSGSVAAHTSDATASVVTTNQMMTVTQTMQQPKLLLKWLPSDPAHLLHGIFGPVHISSKLACFDIDGTLISTSSGARFPKSPQDWKFWCGKGNVETRLKECHAKGYSIVFVSNQNYAPHTKAHQNFKSKIPLIGKSLGQIPFRVLAATAKDSYRKPDTGIWKLLEKTYSAEGHALDKSRSFYVGDAAGRPSRSVGVPMPNGKTVKRQFERDHSDSDKMWARNVGIPFYTPEEFFWDRKDEAATLASSDAATAV